tara:strand:- start:25058 stop:25936 length:879 start_codon:yes stop_codon:yes gene_type:complete
MLPNGLRIANDGKNLNMSISTDSYGVMGYPISHSYSPVIHNTFASQTQQSIEYKRLEVSPNELESEIIKFQKKGGKGLNITLPHKTEVLKLADQITERASIGGAANTLTFKDGQIFADNTDGIGLIRDLSVNLNIPLENKSILILGAGGATRGIVSLILDMKPKSLLIANRTISKAEMLAIHFSNLGPISACQLNEIPASKNYDLIVNATSAGIKGEKTFYPTGIISNKTYCYDLSYSLKPTPFNKWALNSGAYQSFMGWGMLVEQAAESFSLWRGVRPNTGPVLKQLITSA